MKKLKLSKLSQNELQKKEMNYIKGGAAEQISSYLCFCWTGCYKSCRLSPEQARANCKAPYHDFKKAN